MKQAQLCRSSLRHVLDQFRLQQSGNVDLEFYPAGSPDAPSGRLGRDQGTSRGGACKLAPGLPSACKPVAVIVPQGSHLLHVCSP